MGKKAREYKSGDFIFAKVKGYPAWPARVQRLNGKKYFVYFYGTGETANLPPNQIFDYAENKDKFLTKTQKRKDFNDGVRQIEHDFTNNVPLEEIIGAAEAMETGADETANDSALDETADTSGADTTAADTTVADTTAADDEQDTTAAADAAPTAPVEDSDDGALVIDEGGKKGKKSAAAKPKEAKEAKESATPKTKEAKESATPKTKEAKEPATPKTKEVKEPATPKTKEAKTPRGRPKRDEKEKEGEDEEEKREEEIVSRSGRKIRPKRFVDEQTEENATLPTPAAKKKRGASPAAEKEKEKPEKPAKNVEPVPEKKTFNAVLPSELEDLKEPYPTDAETNFYQDEKFLDASQNDDTTSNKPAKVPVFGKKSTNKPKLDNQITKKKKFCPPTKPQPINSSQNFGVPLRNESKSKEILKQESFTEKEKDFSRFFGFQSTNEFNGNEITAEKHPNDFDDEMMTQNSYNPHDQMMQTQYSQETPQTLEKQWSFCLGNAILNSLNLLNDEDIILSQQNTQVSNNNLITMEVRKIGPTEVITLSQNGKIESICSVLSLNKVYKNLDKHSFEEKIYTEENNALENDPKEIEHKIPEGDDFLMLFQDGDARVKEKVFSNVMTPQIEAMEHVDWLNEDKMADQEKYGGEESDKENILICHLPSGQYVGIKLFRDRPSTFKTDAHRLNWDKRQADNAITLKTQLERGHISATSVIAQLETELNLTDEEKANLDREREIEEKKCRVQFLKTEMKLIELDAKIKSCLSLEKADTELCIKLLNEMAELSIKPLMLLKHPTTAETVKRVRAYVGNAPSWQLSETDALAFSARAQRIREQADTLYSTIKELFPTPEGLSFWEYFSERVALYKKCTAKLTPDERLEMVHEPIELSSPSSHTMRAAIDAANEEVKATDDATTPATKKTKAPAKTKKAPAPAKTPAKRQSARAKQNDAENKQDEGDKPTEAEAEPTKDKEPEPAEPKEAEPEKETKPTEEQNDKNNKDKTIEEENTKPENKEETNGPTEQSNEDHKDKSDEDKDSPKESNIENGTGEAEVEKEKGVENEKETKETEKEKKKEKEEKEDLAEPRAKRGRECNKKTEAPAPKSPTKRKSRS